MLPSALVGAAFLLGGGVAAWGAVQTFVVNSTADVANSSPTSKVCATAGTNPVCTLRAAIQASNANSGTDTISLPAGVYTLTIAGRNEDAAATGDLDITDAVTVTGAGAGSAIIDGNGIDRVFDVFASGTTTISGVTIRNGNPGAATGGGILAGGVGNNVVSLNLSNVIVTQTRSSECHSGVPDRALARGGGHVGSEVTKHAPRVDEHAKCDTANAAHLVAVYRVASRKVVAVP